MTPETDRLRGGWALVLLATALTAPYLLADVRPVALAYRDHAGLEPLALTGVLAGLVVLAVGIVKVLQTRVWTGRSRVMSQSGAARTVGAAGWVLLGAGAWAAVPTVLLLVSAALVQASGCGVDDGNDACGFGTALLAALGLGVSGLSGLVGLALVQIAHRKVRS